MQANSIILPSWLGNKAVFQQGVPFYIEGRAAPSATVTLEIVKDPTDGRRVSKLDAEYGVILSLEATTSAKGNFRFNVPAYKASSDTYTFIFKCFADTVTYNDIRCGDVWVFLGSGLPAVPMSNANAPAAPLKRAIMSNLRFFTPARTGLESGEEDIAYAPKEYLRDAEWIRVEDTSELADVSSTCFAFAYSLADQIQYPVGVVDLSADNSTILNWLSDDVIENQTALRDYIEELGLLTDEARYESLIAGDRKKRKTAKLETEVTQGRSFFDFDLSKSDELNKLHDEDTTAEAIKKMQELDFPSSSNSSMRSTAKAPTDTQSTTPTSSAMNLDFGMISEIRIKTDKKVEDSRFIKHKYRPSIFWRAKLYPVRQMSIRGLCYCPDTDESMFGRYDLLLMGLLETLASNFEPREVYEDELMPSMLFVAMHPKSVDYEHPYKVIEFNENLTAFTRRLAMPTGIIGLHDLLLPDKTKSFTLGTRLAVVALGIHFTPKMPASCPECSGVEKAGNKLILKFDNLGDGLRLAEGETELRGFAICGQDRIFYPAQARILHGVRVMVWRDDITDPVSVTYGFQPFPHEATFRNLNDLPVLPFRFDREPSYYAPDLFFNNCDKLEFVGMREPGGEFEKLKVYKTFKGNGVITEDTMNKTEGRSSLHIRYETENSLYGFEPNLDYASLFAPITIYGKRRILVDIFNPEQKRKRLRVEGFGEGEIKQQLTWQTIALDYKGEGDIVIDHLRFSIEDTDRNGEIYVDNIRFE